MKLSDPRTIQKNISDQRRMDIDNGILLARKIDKLREDLLVEENKHNLFIKRTVEELHSKTDELSLEISYKEKKLKEIELEIENKKQLLNN